jgi:hypothetical protein
VPWDWSAIGSEIPLGERPNQQYQDESKLTPKEREALSIKQQIEERRKEMVDEHEEETERIEDEFRDANESYGS